jgi:hypothetical protein
MKQHSRLSILCPVVLWLAACSAPHEPPPESPPRPKTVFDPLTQQMDRARAVQGTVDQHTADTRKQVEAAEGSDSSP